MSPADIPLLAQLIAAIVGVASLILSAYSLYLRRKEKQPNIRVSIKMGWAPPPTPLDAFVVLAIIGNVGEKKVVITSFSFRCKNYERVFQPQGTEQIPFELDPGKGATFWMPSSDLATDLKQKGFGGEVKLKVCFEDAVRNKYWSKDYKFDIDERWRTRIQWKIE